MDVLPTPSYRAPTMKQKVIVIAGPTGVGKSKLAIEVARQLNGEIISADSVQIYRGLDVGSAKPSLKARKAIPHHLVDILHPAEDYSAGQFFEDARKVTNDILYCGHVPVVSGGTGLYLQWYVHGKPHVPKASSEVSAQVHSELMNLQKTGDWSSAVELLEKAGDPCARLITRNNWYRLRRSLEIIKSTGSPPSSFSIPYNSFKQEMHLLSMSGCNNVSAAYAAKEYVNEFDFQCYFLSSNRLDLYRWIDLRCEEMLIGGLLSEAMWLLDSGLYPNINSATRAIGYEQAMVYLLNCRHNGGYSCPEDFFAFLSNFQKASRNLVKKQMTWFSREPIYCWLDASNPLDKLLNFIVGAYHDESAEFGVPESLKACRKVPLHGEYLKLKAYHSENRIFINEAACSPVLDFVQNMQRR